MKFVREFEDAGGRCWRVSYTGAGIRGLVTMDQIVFKRIETGKTGAELYLTVHPGYLERADEQQLQVALSQAQPVDPPW